MISFQDVTFTYPGGSKPALAHINLEIPTGVLCIVMGPSGSGKSTLLRCINGLVPHFSGGSLQGTIRVNGLDPVKLSPQEMSRTVGFVFQDPEAQFVVDQVEDELAFALENAALPVAEIEQRVNAALDLLELCPLRTRRLETLSGGEKQKVAIAAALALKPEILVLDEPTSQLDPQSAEEVLQALAKLSTELKLTILLAEHRIERVLPFAGQIIYLPEDASGVISAEPGEVLAKVPLVPPVVALGKALGWQPLPLTIDEARRQAERSLEQLPQVNPPTAPIQPSINRDDRQAFIRAEGVGVSYGKLEALHQVNLSVYPGEISVLMGSNGAGKTSLLRAMLGLTPLQAGKVTVSGRDISGRSVADVCQQVGYLPQDPNALLFADTLGEELLITLRNHRIEPASLEISPEQLLQRLGLADKAGLYPRDLSTGERQRAALGAVMVTHPGALLLDEPTRGLDYAAKRFLQDLLRQWRGDGMAILLVTHDVELAAQVADRVILLEQGSIIADGSPWEVMSHSPKFIPQVAQIFPQGGWLTVEQAMGSLHAR